MVAATSSGHGGRRLAALGSSREHFDDLSWECASESVGRALRANFRGRAAFPLGNGMSQQLSYIAKHLLGADPRRISQKRMQSASSLEN